MICPNCNNYISFFRCKKHFKCPVCNHALTLKVKKSLGIWEGIVGTFVLLALPIPKNEIAQWPVLIFYISMVYFAFYRINSYLEPDA